MNCDYEKYWNSKESYDFEYGACRARNLAEEIVVGWRDQADLDGFEHKLTAHALEFFGEMIDDGLAEAHHDKFACGSIAHACRITAWRMLESDTSQLGYAETMLAARALKAFSGWLQSRLDEPPTPARRAALRGDRRAGAFRGF